MTTHTLNKISSISVHRLLERDSTHQFQKGNKSNGFLEQLEILFHPFFISYNESP